MKPILSICLFLLVGTAALFAEEDTRVVKFRLLCYEQCKDLMKAMVEGDSGTTQEVEFLTGGFTPQATGRFTGGIARFFIEIPGPDGKPVRKIVAAGKLNSSAVQMFLLLPETKPDGAVYRILAFDDQESSFPMGSIRLINLASFPVRLNLAGVDLPPVKSGGLQVYPQVRKVDEWNMFTARIDFGVEEKKWVPVATQSWKSTDRKRDWVITRFDPTTKTPAIRLYQDIPPWRETVLPVSRVKN